MSEEAEADEADQADDVDEEAESADTEEEQTEEQATTDEEAQAETDDETDEAVDGLQAGDFIELDYTARTVEDEMIVDTTYQEVAEEEGIDDEDRTFEPRTLVLGEGFIFEQVEDEIIGQEVGASGSVEIPAAEAFGEVDQENVRTIKADRIDEDNRYPGAQVQIDGEQGRIETIVGGRARVNFNHPLAGEDIEYEYEVVGTVDDRLEQARSLFQMYLDMELEMWIQTDEEEEERLVQPDEDEEAEEAADGDEESEADDEDEEPPEPETEVVEVEHETLYIEANPQLTMNQQWMFQKQQICQQVIDLLGIDRVIIQEIIDGQGMGMMGGMGGMMGGAMGGAGEEEIEEALEDSDVDAEEIVEEIEEAADE